MNRREQVLDMLHDLNEHEVGIEEYKTGIFAEIAISLAVIADELREMRKKGDQSIRVEGDDGKAFD